MTAIEKTLSFTRCCDYQKCDDCPWEGKCSLSDVNPALRKELAELKTNSKLQEQYVTKLESDNEKLRKIVNILCDTISQLI